MEAHQSIHETVAYITPEIALGQRLPTYSGGLGVLAGGAAMSAKRLGIPVVYVGILAKQGYYHQYIEGDRRQDDRRMGVDHIEAQFTDMMEDTGVLIEVLIAGSPTLVKVWKLPGERFDSVDGYFVDTDIPENSEVARTNTRYLYAGTSSTGRNIERQIAQSIVLGFASVELFEALGIDIGLYHLNESHVAFTGIALLKKHMQAGMSYADAVDHVRSQMVFTTHTPVPAGNPTYHIGAIYKMLGDEEILTKDVLRRIGCASPDSDDFNMGIACLRLSRKANGVSQKHGIVAHRMWGEVEGVAPITSITNGSDREFWQFRSFSEANTPEELQMAKTLHKRSLLRYVTEATGRCWSEGVFTVVWARRFAEYKRPWLLCSDVDWITRMLSQNKLQVIYAGKPHPDDLKMVETWDWLLGMSNKLHNLAVLPGYELELSKLVKGGADLWLNNPRAPDEACGTSGQSAAMNGVINVSTLDGWMLEANPDNFFAFGAQERIEKQDEHDARDLRRVIESAAEMYYFDKFGWYNMALAAKKEAEEYWTSDRMVLEYLSELYMDEE